MPRKGQVSGFVQDAGGVLNKVVPGAKGVGDLAAGILRIFNLQRKAAASNRKAKKSKGKKKKASTSQKGNLGPVSITANKAGVGVQVPASVPKTYQSTAPNPNRKDGIIIRACEGFSPSTTVTMGDTMHCEQIPLSPLSTQLFPWLSAQSPLWTKFNFTKLRAHFIPSASTSAAETWFEAYSPDVEMDDIPSLQAVMQMAQKQMSVRWQPHVFDVDLAQESTDPFYIDSDGNDDRIENQGIFSYGVANTAVDDENQTFTPGMLFMEYEVELYDRKPSVLSLYATQMLHVLTNTQIPRELRVRAGNALCEEVLRGRPSKELDGLTKLERQVRKVEKMLPAPAARVPASPVTALPSRLVGK